MLFSRFSQSKSNINSSSSIHIGKIHRHPPPRPPHESFPLWLAIWNTSTLRHNRWYQRIQGAEYLVSSRTLLLKRCLVTACRIIVINAARLLKYPQHSAVSRSLTRTINEEYGREKTAACVDSWTIFETSPHLVLFLEKYHSFDGREPNDDSCWVYDHSFFYYLCIISLNMFVSISMCVFLMIAMI